MSKHAKQMLQKIKGTLKTNDEELNLLQRQIFFSVDLCQFVLQILFKKKKNLSIKIHLTRRKRFG